MEPEPMRVTTPRPESDDAAATKHPSSQLCARSPDSLQCTYSDELSTSAGAKARPHYRLARCNSWRCDEQTVLDETHTLTVINN